MKGKAESLKVVIPTAKEDRGISSKVGIIATIGFVVGVLWPKLLGVHVGPNVPGGGEDKSSRDVAAPAASAKGSADAAPMGTGGPKMDPDASDEPSADASPASNKELVVVGEGVISSCRNKKGDKMDDCGKLAFDKLALGRLGELSKCPDTLGLEGTASVGVAINFDKSELTVVEGKKSSLPMTTVRGILRCAGKELEGVELDKLVHTHARYVVEYPLTFYPPGKAPPEKGAEDAPAEAPGKGTVTIAWEKGLLRDSPESGKVVHRLPQGTRVTILEEQKGWFLVQAGKRKGWLAAGAIGK